MIARFHQGRLLHLIDHNPAVVLLGPRQVGKTTLALDVAETRPAVYLDLESETDRAKLDDPELYLAGHEDRLVILDEVHRVPELFQSLRGLIDSGRRRGLRSGRFLLLGSASIDLLKQSGETLAGRVAYLELAPVNVLEAGPERFDDLWVRGGFPESLLAADDGLSLEWRRHFIRTYLERDIPMLGPRIPAETLRRFWTMLAHNQGTLLNAAGLARGLGVDGKTVASYLDLLVDLLLVRRLSPWHRNAGKRLVKSPKTYVRDSGLAHALLGLADRESLLGHPVAGGSWEGHVIESILSVAPPGTEPAFYRTSAGAEIDLLLTVPGGGLWAIEIKRSLAPKPDRGFHSACADLAPERRFLVYPGAERYPIRDGIDVISLSGLMAALVDLWPDRRR
ncbi:MAG: ATP-binding protein [Hyphomicrobiales bacterium]|nr:ATP-binding protein [Hyphomicrobiales bacterium]MCP5372399.1 ATP-binding protein [Hyphomicrobiales bacterium]